MKWSSSFVGQAASGGRVGPFTIVRITDTGGTVTHEMLTARVRTRRQGRQQRFRRGPARR